MTMVSTEVASSIGAGWALQAGSLSDLTCSYTKKGFGLPLLIDLIDKYTITQLKDSKVRCSSVS